MNCAAGLQQAATLDELLQVPVAVQEQLWNEQQLDSPVAQPQLRLWRYSDPAIVLGCSQRKLLGQEQADPHLPVLIRQSGGGAVLTGPWMLGISAALPAGHPLVQGGPVAGYRWFGEVIAQTLTDCGVQAVALDPRVLHERYAGGQRKVDWACFGGLSPWEVLADGRKIAGLAQVRRRAGVLLVGGVLVEPSPWPLLCSALGGSALDAARLATTTISCTECAGELFERGRWTELLEQRLREAMSAQVAHPIDS